MQNNPALLIRLLGDIVVEHKVKPGKTEMLIGQLNQ